MEKVLNSRGQILFKLLNLMQFYLGGGVGGEAGAG